MHLENAGLGRTLLWTIRKSAILVPLKCEELNDDAGTFFFFTIPDD